MSGNAEKTGFVVPIYRFNILLDYIKNNNETNIVIPKPILYFDSQNIIQDELRNYIFKDEYNRFRRYIKNKIGVRISLINPDYYYSKKLKSDLIILSINSNDIDNLGNIKFNFYPEKISINELGLWFTPGNELVFELFDPNTKNITFEKIYLNDLPKHIRINEKNFFFVGTTLSKINHFIGKK